MKIDFRSLNFRLWLYFMVFAALVLGCLWVLQSVWVDSFYESTKLKSVGSVVDDLQKGLGEDQSAAELQQKAEELAYANNVYIRMVDIRGETVCSADAIGFNSILNGEDYDWTGFNQQLLKQATRTLSVRLGAGNFGTRVILHGQVLSNAQGENVMLYVISPIDPRSNAAMSILRQQLVYVSAMVIMMAALISMFISMGIASPIVRMTRSAQKLAKGDYTVTFEKSEYSEINQLSETLDYAAKELGQVDDLRRDLIANVSHDLRTPLTMIKAYGEMIRDLSGDNPEKRTEHVNIIIDESDRMAELVNDMLELSKLQAGTVKLDMERMDVAGIMTSVVRRFMLYPKTSDYHFIYEGPDECWVTGDAAAIERVIYNLVNNAVMYAGEDKTIVLRLTEQAQSVRVEISDSGPGIPADKLNSIWDRYYRLDKKRSRSTLGGTGLGLYIVKTIMEGHGQPYGAKSTEGKGSTFWFGLAKADEGGGRVSLRSKLQGTFGQKD
ncbi:MAG: HAMP domain-containing sensor histidine kinase [Eubacteriales bacterium]|nr:HAMP domain-containing sensor histidine kinase [Eubacteriales bacterium]